MQNSIPKFRRMLASRERVLAAAMEEFCTSGYAGARLEDIARRIGVTKAAIYLSFASKQEILEALVVDSCLAERPEPGATPTIALAGQLQAGDGLRILDLVLGEYRTMPGLGTKYLEALVSKLSRWPGVSSISEARRLARIAIAAKAFELMFDRPQEATVAA